MDHDDIVAILELALAETDSEVARSLFYGAWRCNELRRKNERLEAIIRQFDSDQTASSAIDWANQEPYSEQYYQNSGSAGVRYFRALAEHQNDDKVAEGLLGIADMAMKLQVQNRVLRETLGVRVRAVRGQDNWSSWSSDATHERESQNECICSGEFRPVCHRCQEDAGRLRSFTALLASRASERARRSL
jgi:hypothetical protein